MTSINILSARLRAELTILTPNSTPEDREAIINALCRHLLNSRPAPPPRLLPTVGYQPPTAWTGPSAQAG
ncbi:hypothetical protein H9Y04_24805 [Streptomyces sp. TRM66268-LWL]|uniref:Acyl-CoA carboxylase subunit epsilon n=1 Tax=Streptomyces polyasparticus TaxID=2767826 RepID=A0ABR7SMN6_9ACTN|nr:hypothetical protein [Streptomyces polyasparticus]MBC9715766.1 hypothetical protein [Streptomyces polyasparticus]